MHNFKNIPSDEFFYEIFPQFWGNLEGIDSKTQQDLNDAFDVLVLEVLFEFLFVFLDDWLADKLSALNSAFVDDNFVVFAELYFIVFDGVV